MFERFTDRARRVLVLAQEEARLLNHSFIGTEHILLGLIHEGEGVGAQALASLGVTLESARRTVKEILDSDISLGPSGSPPFTPRAKKVLELSLREALQLQHNHIGTEHLLLGLLREGGGVAVQVLVSLGIDLNQLRQLTLDLIPEELAHKEEFRRRERVHVLEGLIRAVEDIDRVTDLVKGRPDRSAAVASLMDSPLQFSEIQAERVLDLHVGSLTADRIQALRHELAMWQETEGDEDSGS
jgi:ATP-dependent Clp protease ATP-binding subunit ClpA